jgi:hypothetical protein
LYFSSLLSDRETEDGYKKPACVFIVKLSHHEESYLLGCNAVLFGTPTFRRKVLLGKPREKPARTKG